MTGRGQWWAIGGVLILLAAAAVGAGVLWVRRTDQVPVPTTVVLEASTDPGADPFRVARSETRPSSTGLHMANAGSAVAAVTATVDPDTGARTVAGTTDRLYAASAPDYQELYGGSGSLSACDAATIADFLAAHPDKAAAWAQVRGIAPEQIGSYLAVLTPVLLLHDTLVTNHGFVDGVATPRASVLQAGTAVLVDATGLPVVRCACGNPLSAPPPTNLSAATLVGEPWDGYDANRTVVVTAGPPVGQFVVVDAHSGQDITLTAGAPATPAPATTAPVTAASASTAPATSAPSSLAATSATSGAHDCELDLHWPAAVPGWIDIREGSLTCEEMARVWSRYEQWPGERGGSWQLVEFDDGWDCTNAHLLPQAGAVGGCVKGKQSFIAGTGQPGPPTTVPASGQSTAQSGPTAAADVLVTPSGNIVCARRDGRFACTIKQFDFDLGDESCAGARGPIVRLDATGASRASSCRGDFFDIPALPDPTPYGTTATLGDITCDVEESGLTCTNPEGHGFTLSRAGLTPR